MEGGEAVLKLELVWSGALHLSSVSLASSITVIAFITRCPCSTETGRCSCCMLGCILDDCLGAPWAGCPLLDVPGEKTVDNGPLSSPFWMSTHHSGLLWVGKGQDAHCLLRGSPLLTATVLSGVLVVF